MHKMESETCRICAIAYPSESDQEFLNIFEPHVKESLRAEQEFIINEISSWHLQIVPNDGLPQRICENCFAKFSTINAFRQECAATQNLLRETLQAQGQKNGDAPVIAIPMETIIMQANNGDRVAQELLANGQTIDSGTCSNATDMTVNYKVSFDANAPNRIVINEESNVSDAKNNINIATSEDLEDMLTGSIIPKNLTINAPPEKSDGRKVDEKDEFSDSDDDDHMNERPAFRLSKYPFACNYCFCPPIGSIEHLIFESSEELSQHFFDGHDPKAPYVCPECPKLFKANKRRNFHVRKVHKIGNKRIVKCLYCLKAVRTTLEVHDNTCTYISDWKCRVCNRVFHQLPRHVFRAHQKSHISTIVYRCEPCRRNFLRRGNYEAHLKTHEAEGPMDVWEECVECNQTFATVHKLRKHEVEAHRGKEFYRCEYCNNGYSSRMYLQRHVRKFHSSQEKEKTSTFSCSNCGVTFPSKIKLYFHQQRIKDENGQCILQTPPNSRQPYRLLSCPHCPRLFTTQDNLNLHLEAHEAKLLQHACDKCSMRFHTALGLMEHLKSGRHLPKENETPSFQCSISDCLTEFKSETELSQHLRTNHEPVPCEFCAEIFTRGELRVHQNSGPCQKTNYVNGSIADSGIDPDSLSSSVNSNACIQYVNNHHPSIKIKKNRTATEKPQRNLTTFFHSDEESNSQHNDPVAPSNDADYFISSLLETENEIVVA